MSVENVRQSDPSIEIPHGIHLGVCDDGTPKEKVEVRRNALNLGFA